LRDHLLYLLRGGGAHLDFESAIAGLPANLRGAKPASLPHTPWRLLEHMRLAQWDILEFCRNPKHVSPDFPDGYWPRGDAPPDAGAWDRSADAFRADLRVMQELVADASSDPPPRGAARRGSQCLPPGPVRDGPATAGGVARASIVVPPLPADVQFLTLER